MTSIITTQLLTTAAHIGSVTLSSIYHTTEFLISGSHIHVSETLEDLDIVNKIKIIEALIIELTDNDKYKFKKSVKLALDSVHDIIAKINTELLDIKKECEYHETRYFHYWRYPNCTQLLINLQKHISILDHRVDLLKEIIKII